MNETETGQYCTAKEILVGSPQRADGILHCPSHRRHHRHHAVNPRSGSNPRARTLGIELAARARVVMVRGVCPGDCRESSQGWDVSKCLNV